MAKTKISEFSATPANNTDIDGINIAEGCAPSGINDAIRELMSQLKDWQSGTSNDPMVIGSSGSLTLSYGTANGVPYLNGSKVLTSGSSLVFDGTNLGVGTSSTLGNSTVNAVLGFAARNSGATPGYFQTYNSNAGADLKTWRFGGDSSGNLVFQTVNDAYSSATTRLTADASGNLGLGVTPSAWGSAAKAFEQTAGGLYYNGFGLCLGNNHYFNGSSYIYKNNGLAALYSEYNGQHIWYNAPSGTAGNAITFTQAMTLDSVGNLSLGTGTSAWNSAFNNSVIQKSGTSGVNIVLAAAGNVALAQNAYVNSGGAMRSMGTGYAHYVSGNSSNGEFAFQGINTSATGDASISLSTWFKLAPNSGTGGYVYAPPAYNTTVTGRTLTVSSTGLLGYVSSTRKSKGNIASLNDVSWLLDLEPVSFQYRKMTEDQSEYLDDLVDDTEYGLIADDAEQVNEDIVFHDVVDGEKVLRGVHYNKLIAPMLKLVQQQQAIIESLKARLDAANL